MKRKSAIFFALVFIFVLFSACSNSGSSSNLNKAGKLHNSKLGIDISLGMKKEALDKALGPSSVIGSYTFYSDQGLTVTYKNGVAAMFATSNADWETMDGIKASTSSGDVTKLYGSSASSDSLTYMFTKDSKVTTNINTATVNVIFKISNDKVSNINISEIRN